MTSEEREHLEALVGPNRVIVVSSEKEYIGLVNWKRVFTMLTSDAARSILQRKTTRIVRSPSKEFSLPLVVEIDKSPHKKEIDPSQHTSKRLILIRDDWTCKYCGMFGDTIDHIYPKSLGGPNTWENLCAACRDCNEYKSDYLLEDMGWERPELDLDFIPRPSSSEVQIAKKVEAILP